MPVLTLVDITGIQRFVFGSTRLRQIVGASALLQEVTGEVIDKESVSPKGWPELLGYKKHVISASGGNILLDFSNITEAKEFAAKLSNCTLRYAPELEMVMVHEEYEVGRIGEATYRIYNQRMPKAKAQFIPRGSLLNLGITEECFETGHVAAAYDQEGNPVSLSTMFKNERGKRLVPFDDFLTNLNYRSFRPRFPLEIDHLGRTLTESSLIGIVYMDANNTGLHFSNWIKEHCHLPDEEFKNRYRKICSGLSTAVGQTVEAVLKRVDSSIQIGKQGYAIVGAKDKANSQFSLWQAANKDKDGKDIVYLPIRPIITAGEDIAFVCDARIALDLAAFAIQEFECQQVPEFGNLTMSAGVSIVHAHSPFIRAYETAEQLCSNAKKRVQEHHERAGQLRSAIDWHIAAPGTIEPINEIREQIRALDGRCLTMRPYLINPTAETGTWQWFTQEILFGKHGFLGSNWASHRSKANALRHLATQGQHAVRKSIENWKLTASDVALPEALRANDGFLLSPESKEMATPIIDALELLDLHIALKEG